MNKTITYRLWVRMWNDEVKVYHTVGDIKDLYTLIGYLYSNSLEKIDRISYHEIKRPLFEDETYLIVSDGGHLREYDYNGTLQHTFK